MLTSRRTFLRAAAALPFVPAAGRAEEKPAAKPRPNRIGISTYSFWQFQHKDRQDIETCIDLAAEMNFDGVEILHVQMTDTSNAALQKIKKRAFANGLDLMGFSTHQTFLRASKEERQKNVDHTIKCIEVGLRPGHPDHVR